MRKLTLRSLSGLRLNLLLVMMTFGLLLASCGDSTPTTAPVASTPTTSAATTAAVAATTAASATTASAGAATTAATPATTLAPVATTQATTAAAVDPSKLAPVELTYIYPAFFGVQKDTQAVQDALNVIVKAKINATVKLQPIDGGAFDQKIKLANAAGEKYDIVFTAPWINNYTQNITNGSLIPLDELLPKFAPGLYSSLPTSVWAAPKVNGKIYGVINQQIFPRTSGVTIRKDLAEKYKLDLNTINKYEDLEPFLAQVKAGEPGVTPFYSIGDNLGILFRSEYIGVDPLDGTGDNALVGIKYDDKDFKVFNVVETPEFKKVVELQRKWYQAGYFLKDPLPVAEADSAMKSGKFAAYLSISAPDAPGNFKGRFGFDFVSKPLVKPILNTAGVTATMNGISRTSANPERAMMFLELINTDKTAFRLLAQGIEGKHYTVVDKDKELIEVAKDSAYNPNTNWLFGKAFNGYYIDAAQVGSWDAVRKINESAVPSVALGFAFNQEPVKTEFAQVEAVKKQYGYPLLYGVTDPATAIPEFASKMKAAGSEKIIAELQKQLDAWRKTK